MPIEYDYVTSEPAPDLYLEAQEALKNLNAGLLSIQDCRNLNCYITHTQNTLENQQLYNKYSGSVLTEEEFDYIYDKWKEETAIFSTPSRIFGNPLYKILENQPLESLGYIFKRKFCHREFRLVFSVLKSFGFDVSDNRLKAYKNKFSMFSDREKSYLALKSIYGDIMRGVYDGES